LVRPEYVRIVTCGWSFTLNLQAKDIFQRSREILVHMGIYVHPSTTVFRRVASRKPSVGRAHTLPFPTTLLSTHNLQNESTVAFGSFPSEWLRKPFSAHQAPAPDQLPIACELWLLGWECVCCAHCMFMNPDGVFGVRVRDFPGSSLLSLGRWSKASVCPRALLLESTESQFPRVKRVVLTVEIRVRYPAPCASSCLLYKHG
jgi:hypothetical protein